MYLRRQYLPSIRVAKLQLAPLLKVSAHPLSGLYSSLKALRTPLLLLLLPLPGCAFCDVRALFTVTPVTFTFSAATRTARVRWCTAVVPACQGLQTHTWQSCCAMLLSSRGLVSCEAVLRHKLQLQRYLGTSQLESFGHRWTQHCAAEADLGFCVHFLSGKESITHLWQ